MTPADDTPERTRTAGPTTRIELGAVADRYEDRGRVGLGGMSEVRRVFDRVLDRVVAMKIDLVDGAGAPVSDAIGEARIAARLQHPGVVPVYDAGRLPDGRRFVTMPFVEGHTLADWLGSAHPLAEGARVALAVATVLEVAHAAGVVHRDVTPRNVLIGARGEVRVSDWGIACAIGARPGAGGTPGFASAAQLAGAPAAPADDLYAFGVLLGRILDVCSPDDAHLRSVVDQALAGAPASELVSALRAHVDGAARRARADALVAEAARAEEDAVVLLRDAHRRRSRAERAVARLDPTDAGPRRDRAGRDRRRAELLAARAAAVDEQAVNLLRSALALDPGHPEAAETFSAGLRRRLDEAERDGDDRRVEALAAELAWRAPALWRRWRDAPARLVVSTTPVSAAVSARRWDVGDGRYVLGPVVALGETPLDAALPPGRWRVTLRDPRGGEVVYPVHLRRGERHAPCLADGTEAPVVLPGPLPPDDCYVPAGWFVAGGDVHAVDGFPATRVWVDGFVLRRFPVTVEEYRAFLADLPPDEAVACAPRGLPLAEDGPVRVGGVWVCGCDPRHPVTGIDLAGAERYAAWVAARTGLPWRLPHELEWEKAARGVDRRRLPWGDLFEGPWANWPQSRRGAPGRTSVDTFPTDESPYGVRGLAGNVREWCGNDWRERPVDGGTCPRPPFRPGALRAVRGGMWGAVARQGSATSRFAAPAAGFWGRVVGFRLARSVTGGAG